MTTNIHHLIDQYFAGETTSEEEKTLRRYFAQDNLPAEMQALAPIFRFMEDEAKALAVLNEIRDEEQRPASKKPTRLRTLMWTISAIAASFLLGIILLNVPAKKNDAFAENCVWVNGKRVTDPDVVRQYAEKSFGKVKTDENIIEQQLSFIME